MFKNSLKGTHAWETCWRVDSTKVSNANNTICWISKDPTKTESTYIVVCTMSPHLIVYVMWVFLDVFAFMHQVVKLIQNIYKPIEKLCIFIAQYLIGIMTRVMIRCTWLSCERWFFAIFQACLVYTSEDSHTNCISTPWSLCSYLLSLRRWHQFVTSNLRCKFSWIFCPILQSFLCDLCHVMLCYVEYASVYVYVCVCLLGERGEGAEQDLK